MDSFEKDCENHLKWMESLLDNEEEKTKKDQNDYQQEIDQLIARIQSGTKKIPQNEIHEEPQYKISDEYSDEENENSSNFEINDENEVRGQTIPIWAKASNLLVELQKQQTIDPDTIFLNFDYTCDLCKMFDSKKRSFKVRGDSGWWAGDGTTQNEISQYKKAVGLI